MIKNASIIRHIGEERLGTFREVFEEEGVAYKYIDAAHDDMTAIDPLEPDLLIVMGGPIGVYDSDHYPFLKHEIKILEKRLAADKPTLGICLGSQLMAAALGAKNYKGDRGFEAGWHPIAVNEQGKQTPLAYLDQSHTNMFHWHGDTFDLPKGAVLLASSAKYERQAYRWGKNALGLQCHPEVTSRMLREWFIVFVNQVTGPNAIQDLAKLRAETEKNMPVMQAQTKKFFKDWLKQREF